MLSIPKTPPDPIDSVSVVHNGVKYVVKLFISYIGVYIEFPSGKTTLPLATAPLPRYHGGVIEDVIVADVNDAIVFIVKILGSGHVKLKLRKRSLDSFFQ